MAPKVGHNPLPTGGHGRDELLPAATALGEAVEKGDRRAFAGDYIVEANVGTLQNRHS
jgi:hypothetical protein